jgi:multimeric flavodoxin WrbA
MMRITIIYGNERKGSTYNCVRILKEELQNIGNVEFIEFVLPKDLPHFCHGCFNCFLNGEDTCPHYDLVKPIVDEILLSDGIILSSPVYALNVTGSMKAFLDHLCYMWMPHRPKKEMFSKTGMAITTTAGAGINSCKKTMLNALRYLGVKRIYSFGARVKAYKWENIAETNKIRIERKIRKKARKFYYATINRENLSYSKFTKIIFNVIKNMIKNYDDNILDKKYWKQMGWLDEANPFS